ncbi:MAG: hypothetical protein ACK59G_00565 [Cyanobacteriota bacterium]
MAQKRNDRRNLRIACLRRSGWAYDRETKKEVVGRMNHNPFFKDPLFSEVRARWMADRLQAQERYEPMDAIHINAPGSHVYRQHIARTPEGCQISRDEEFGFVVACGEDHPCQRHVPTLSAAYAICQQLMPRKPAP